MKVLWNAGTPRQPHYGARFSRKTVLAETIELFMVRLSLVPEL